MFEELGRAIREEVLGTLFHAQLAPRTPSELRTAQERRDERPDGCSVRARARRPARTRSRRGRSAAELLGAAPSHERPVRAQPVVRVDEREGRPQRPVPVRLGQEVQEVPRRMTAAGAAPHRRRRRSSSRCSEPVRSRTFQALAEDPGVLRFTACSAGATRASSPAWIAGYVAGLGRRRPGRVRGSSKPDGRGPFLGMCGRSGSTGRRREAEIGYVGRTARPRTRPRSAGRSSSCCTAGDSTSSAWRGSRLVIDVENEASAEAGRARRLRARGRQAFGATSRTGSVPTWRIYSRAAPATDAAPASSQRRDTARVLPAPLAARQHHGRDRSRSPARAAARGDRGPARLGP